MKVLIDTVKRVGTEMKLFFLVRDDGSPFASYVPGAHIDVTTPSGAVRQYSLCGNPRDTSTLSILVKPESRGGSESIHTLSAGQTLEIGIPRNGFSLVDDVGPHLLFSAGVGITPILSMAHELDSLARPYTWHHFTRSDDSDDLQEALSLSRFEGRLKLYLDLDRHRIAAEMELALKAEAASRFIYACGPDGFMSTLSGLSSQLLPSASVHTEAFGAATPDANARPFIVHLAKSNATLEVGGHETLIEVLRRNGVSIASGCEQGVCGMCATEVISGSVTHLDDALSDEERNAQRLMCPCVSRGHGYLTLNL
ncbi:PDR/VanB family oxidoreductase [Paraburkholderia sp. CNPSo 3272]|uniref:PDR/VanB family oxidoreductase n=1 Tax=Paraburkholderia sp. CNPSo 3272 TaxID=2940931 RepID=UPI0020B69344|nr:PDR/VanB family oxidoreductase [Paraburkholderia sp. CNPSo 3272]MCP3727091.1 PDR/VanB family oxidoreductase [Paraburkholderia sp. CNPSo 3272]